MTDETTRPSSRERLLDATVELLRTKGPTASGTKEILTRADAPRGSFYFHFPDGKDQLVAEALDRAAAATEEAIRTALQNRSLTTPQRIEKLIEAVAIELAANDYRLGCAIGATVLEASATSPLLRRTTENALTTWTALLTEHFVAEGVVAGRAAALANTVVAGMEGATMMARARRDTAPLEHVAATLGALVAATVNDAR